MRKLSLIVAACALSLTGCGLFLVPPDSDDPKVLVVDGRLTVVNSEPLTFHKRGQVTITWRLPQFSRYTFAEDGIVIEGRLVSQTPREPKGPGQPRDSRAPLLVQQTIVLDKNQIQIVDCNRGKNPKEFSCVNRNTEPGKYKYTIRVMDGSTQLEPLDPWIMNY